MKTILFLAYYYPPVNNAGTQRIEKFVKYLPEFGFKPIVLTTSYFSRHFDRMQSFRLAREIDFQDEKPIVYRAGELRNLVVRRGQTKAQNLSGYSEISPSSFQVRIRHFLRKWFLIPDAKITWLPFAFFKALWIIKKERVEYVVSSFPPATSHLAGLFLKKCTYVKWIADFRDGWCLDPLDPILRHSPARLFGEKILERLVVKNTDHILVTSPDIEKYLGYSEKTTLLTNGFDSNDFVQAKKHLKRLKKWERYFVISHPGAFHFSHPGNTPRYFLEALEGAIREHPEMAEKTKVFFLGNLTPEEKRMPKIMGLKKQVKVLGLKSHEKAIQICLISSVLLLVDRPTSKERSTYIHGKVFEHLASSKPILALFPQKSACRDFLEKLGVGEIVEPQDIEGIKKKIWELFSEWQRGGILRYELTEEELAKFERRNLTKKLAGILKDIRVN